MNELKEVVCSGNCIFAIISFVAGVAVSILATPWGLGFILLAFWLMLNFFLMDN